MYYRRRDRSPFLRRSVEVCFDAFISFGTYSSNLQVGLSLCFSWLKLACLSRRVKRFCAFVECRQTYVCTIRNLPRLLRFSPQLNSFG